MLLVASISGKGFSVCSRLSGIFLLLYYLYTYLVSQNGSVTGKNGNVCFCLLCCVYMGWVDSGVWTGSFVHARQMFYHRDTPQAPLFLVSYKSISNYREHQQQQREKKVRKCFYVLKSNSGLFLEQFPGPACIYRGGQGCYQYQPPPSPLYSALFILASQRLIRS